MKNLKSCLLAVTMLVALQSQSILAVESNLPNTTTTEVATTLAPTTVSEPTTVAPNNNTTVSEPTTVAPEKTETESTVVPGKKPTVTKPTTGTSETTETGTTVTPNPSKPASDPTTSSSETPTTVNPKESKPTTESGKTTETTPPKLGNALITVDNYNPINATFRVNVTGNSTTKTIKKVSVAIWTLQNGQDDLKWYVTDNITTNKYQLNFNIKDFNNKAGDYKVDVYVTYTDGSVYGKEAGVYGMVLYQPTVTRTGNGISVSAGKAFASGVTGNVAVWGQKNGQDDLAWFSMNSNGSLTIPFSALKGGFDTYSVHVYIYQDGKLVATLPGTVDLNRDSLVKPALTIRKIDFTQYEIIIDKLPSFYTSVKMPIWSQANGQDDLHWYTASRISAGKYRMIIDISNHNYSTGLYNVHFYGNNTFTKNSEEMITDTTFAVNNFFAVVRNYNVNNGTFDVVVSRVKENKTVRQIRVAVWSQENKENLNWYTVSGASNGLFTAKINIKNHKNITGNYNVHAYVDFTDGSTEGFVLPMQYLQAIQQGVPYSGYNSWVFPKQYINLLKNPLPTEAAYPGNYYTPGNCTWYIYNRYYQLGKVIYSYLGNAKNWVESGPTHGYSISKTPQVGATVIWTAGYYGHVAFVEHVNPDGSFLFSEMNYAEMLFKIHWREAPGVTDEMYFMYPW